MSPRRFLMRQRAAYRPGTDTPAPYAQAVRAGERIYLSAQSAAEADGLVAVLGDAAAQTNAAMDQLEAALSAAGGSLKDITKLTTSIVDRAHRRESTLRSGTGYLTSTRSARGLSSPASPHRS